nr:hypothetical protein [Ktedonobacterales bacterium]
TYKSLHPSDTRYDSELARYTAIVKMDYSHPADRRGWVYDEFMGIYRLSKDSFFQQAAETLATYYDSQLFQAATGGVYDITSAHPNGFARVDLSLEVGDALIQAGTTFNQPKWISDGRAAVQFIYDHAYIPSYHTFPALVDDLQLPNGAANPNPTIYRGMYGHTKLEGGAVRIGETSLMVLSLLHTYMATQDPSFLRKATDLLDPLTSDQNQLGIWDTKNQGYFAAITFPGTSIRAPGTPTLYSNAKESGRQLQMLEVFRVANTLTNNRYQAMQDTLLQLATHQAYYAPGHGYLYNQSSDWQVLKLRGGGFDDWVTTEAMGIALEGLQALGDPQPW